MDKHIRRLDADLARFEADLKDKMEGSDFESSGARGLKSESARLPLLCCFNSGVLKSSVCGTCEEPSGEGRAWLSLAPPSGVGGDSGGLCCLSEGRAQKEKRGSRGRGRRTSEEDTPKKKKHKGG